MEREDGCKVGKPSTSCGHELEPLRTDRKAFVFFDDVGVLQKEGGAGVGLLLSCATQ